MAIVAALAFVLCCGGFSNVLYIAAAWIVVLWLIVLLSDFRLQVAVAVYLVDPLDRAGHKPSEEWARQIGNDCQGDIQRKVRADCSAPPLGVDMDSHGSRLQLASAAVAAL